MPQGNIIFSTEALSDQLFGKINSGDSRIAINAVSITADGNVEFTITSAAIPDAAKVALTIYSNIPTVGSKIHALRLLPTGDVLASG